MNKKSTLNAKGITIILMLIHHLFAYQPMERYISILPFLHIQGYTIEKIIGLFGKICVTAYLFLSGYGMGKKYKMNIKLNDCIGQCLKLYKIYLIVFFIFIPWRFIIQNEPFSIKEFILNLVGYYSTYNKEWWFLSIYFIFMLLLPLIKRLNTKYLPYISLLIMSIGYIARFILSANITNSNINNFLNSNEWFLIYNILLCQFAFCLGYWMSIGKGSLYFEKLNNIFTRLNTYYLGLAFVIVILLKWKIHGGYIFDTILVPFYIIISIRLAERFKNIQKMLYFLGRYSTYIWLTHTFFCYYYFSEFVYRFKYSPLIFMFTMSLSIVSSLMIDFIYSRTCKTKGGVNESIIYN